MSEATTPRQGILSLTIRDKSALYAAYMPFVNGGGLFIPTKKNYRLGEEVFMLLTLMEETEKIPVAGKIVWITPQGSQGNRAAGIDRVFEKGFIEPLSVSSIGYRIFKPSLRRRFAFWRASHDYEDDLRSSCC